MLKNQSNDLPARKRAGFTLVELLVVIAIIGILIGMLLPAVQAVRAAARRTSCSNNVRQIALALHNYESAHAKFPVNQVGSGSSNGLGGFGSGHYSWLVSLLPQLEQDNLYYSFDLGINNGDGDSYKISDTHPNAEAAGTLVPAFICPSDVANQNNKVLFGSDTAPSSYAGNAGWPSRATGFDGERATPGLANGAIPLVHPSASVDWHVSKIRMSDFLDGTSNTALLSERLIQQANSADGVKSGDPRLKSWHVIERAEPLSDIIDQMANSHSHVRESAHIGRSWSSGWPLAAPTLMHVQTPNSLTGHYDTSVDEGDFVVAASSNHEGGVNLAMVDGSIRFVPDSVEQEVWWAIGGRDDGHLDSFSN